MKNINEVYVDVITGHLHVMLNELFNTKANLVVLDNDLQLVMNSLEILKSKEKEYIATITEQIEKIRELEKDREFLKQENVSKDIEVSKTTILQNKLDELTKRITDFKTIVSDKDKMIAKLSEDFAILNGENQTLKKEYEELRSTNTNKKIKK